MFFALNLSKKLLSASHEKSVSMNMDPTLKGNSRQHPQAAGRELSSELMLGKVVKEFSKGKTE